jgi:hypothetical protein
MAEQAHAEANNLVRLWEEHIRHEFSTRNTDATLKTMVEDAYVDHVPVLTGGSGQAELREFYATHFIPKMPPDMEMVPVSRTVGSDQLVDERSSNSPITSKWIGYCRGSRPLTGESKFHWW